MSTIILSFITFYSILFFIKLSSSSLSILLLTLLLIALITILTDALSIFTDSAFSLNSSLILLIDTKDKFLSAFKIIVDLFPLLDLDISSLDSFLTILLISI